MNDPRSELRSRIAAADDPELAAQAAEALAARVARAQAAEERGPGSLRLTEGENGRLLARRLPAGSWVVYERKPEVDRRRGQREPRRWFTLDRAGHLMEELAWGDDGPLARARVRLADGGWLEVRPRAATHFLFGPADAIVLKRPGEGAGATALTVAAGLDWEAIDHLPALDHPGALPAGGGSALLTLIAGLLTDQARPAVRYRGPYPTPALFDRLLAAFRPLAADLLAARETFTAGVEEYAFSGRAAEPPVDFEPAPPERLLIAEGTLAHMRQGIEAVIDGGRIYSASDRLATLWPGRTGLMVAGLAFLGEPLEEHLVLDPQGDLVARIDDRIAAQGDEEEGVLEAPLDDRWRQAIAALLLSDCTRLLVRVVLDLVLTARIAWGETDGRWVEPRAGGWVVHGALPARFRGRLAAASEAERQPLASAFVAEVATALRDPILRAAQERVEAALFGGAAAAEKAARAGAEGPQVEAGGLVDSLMRLARDLAAGRVP